MNEISFFPKFKEFLNEAAKKKLTKVQKEWEEEKEYLTRALSNKKSKEYKWAHVSVVDAAQVRYSWMRGQWNYNKADKNRTQRLIEFIDEFFPEYSYLFHWTGEPPKELTKKNMFYVGDANMKDGNLKKWFE